RADYLGNLTFRLDGPPLSLKAFGKAKVLRLLEYGAGDRVRHATYAAIRRVAPGVFAVEGDGDATIGFRGARSLEVSADGKAWTPLDATRSGAYLDAAIPLAERGRGFIRVAREKRTDD
ncbi:MAG: hypothetical protein JXP34_25850, partial [Planctomycetes bacterium]|nr:hypothetical protein [Planctomycetota bacterium]